MSIVCCFAGNEVNPGQSFFREYSNLVPQYAAPSFRDHGSLLTVVLRPEQQSSIEIDPARLLQMERIVVQNPENRFEIRLPSEVFGHICDFFSVPKFLMLCWTHNCPTLAAVVGLFALDKRKVLVRDIDPYLAMAAIIMDNGEDLRAAWNRELDRAYNSNQNFFWPDLRVLPLLASVPSSNAGTAAGSGQELA